MADCGNYPSQTKWWTHSWLRLSCGFFQSRYTEKRCRNTEGKQMSLLDRWMWIMWHRINTMGFVSYIYIYIASEMRPMPHLMKMPPYGDSHHKVRLNGLTTIQLYNGNLYTGGMIPRYWYEPLIFTACVCNTRPKWVIFNWITRNPMAEFILKKSDISHCLTDSK